MRALASSVLQRPTNGDVDELLGLVPRAYGLDRPTPKAALKIVVDAEPSRSVSGAVYPVRWCVADLGCDRFETDGHENSFDLETAAQSSTRSRTTRGLQRPSCCFTPDCLRARRSGYSTAASRRQPDQGEHDVGDRRVCVRVARQRGDRSRPDRAVRQRPASPSAGMQYRKQGNTVATPSSARSHAAIVSGMDAHPIASPGWLHVIMAGAECAALAREPESRATGPRMAGWDG
jgi:hypothetical protein